MGSYAWPRGVIRLADGGRSFNEALRREDVIPTVKRTLRVNNLPRFVRRALQLVFEEGAFVAIADVDQPKAEDVARGIVSDGGTAIPLELDVTVERDWEAGVATVLETAGRLDIFVACAGIVHAKPVTEMSLDVWRRVHAVNLDGVSSGLSTPSPP